MVISGLTWVEFQANKLQLKSHSQSPEPSNSPSALNEDTCIVIQSVRPPSWLSQNVPCQGSAFRLENSPLTCVTPLCRHYPVTGKSIKPCN